MSSIAVPGGASAQLHGTFHDRAFAQFTPQEKATWAQDSWRHTWHHHHFGWWWFCDDFWFFDPEPIYPFPTYVGDYYEDANAADYCWYWCDEPPGYYPYVTECNSEWVPVPPTPY